MYRPMYRKYAPRASSDESSTSKKKLTKVQKKEVKSIIARRIEHKAFFAKQDALAVTTTGVVFSISDVPQGQSQGTRVGDQLDVQNILINYDVEVGATGLIAGADQYNSVRIIVFKWKVDDGAQVPSMSNILQSTSSGVAVNRLYNWDDRELYSIVYDKTHTVFNTPIWNGSAVTWQSGYNAHYNNSKPKLFYGTRIAGKKIYYDLNGVVGEGKYYVLAVSDSAFTPNPTMSFSARLTYTDA